MSPRHRLPRAVLILAALATAIPATSAFAARKDPLAGAPAVRHRHELRAGRFEIGPSFGISLNRSLRHTFLVGAKAQFHINDFIAVGADVGFGVGFDTGLTSEIESQYQNANEWTAVANRFGDIQLAGDVRAVFTPFSGKIAVFSKLFLAYDFYGFLGFGFGMTTNNTTEAVLPRNVDAANEGFRPGFAWGVGMNLYINRFISLGMEVRDLMFSDNESGWDMTRGTTELEVNTARANRSRLEEGKFVVDGDDRSFASHFFFGLSVTVMLPMDAKTSR